MTKPIKCRYLIEFNTKCRLKRKHPAVPTEEEYCIRYCKNPSFTDFYICDWSVFYCVMK